MIIPGSTRGIHWGNPRDLREEMVNEHPRVNPWMLKSVDLSAKIVMRL